MTYRNLLAPMAATVQEVGELLAPPRPAPVTSFDELTAVYGASEAPAVAVMRRHLDALRPGVGWADEWEERAAPPAEGEVWVVDVVDGAMQFLQDLPQFCVSLALVRGSAPVAAALHGPRWARPTSPPSARVPPATGCRSARRRRRTRPSLSSRPRADQARAGARVVLAHEVGGDVAGLGGAHAGQGRHEHAVVRVVNAGRASRWVKLGMGIPSSRHRPAVIGVLGMCPAAQCPTGGSAWGVLGD
ncbi:inositol monophosphatase family protein [Streptomyces sp. NPDC002573]|uniref:inositol monophosphatase family protein n=1 Tax=Streptomyces sp. NPDC002573 TaxID=3364651 RepID=UPI0036B0282E